MVSFLGSIVLAYTVNEVSDKIATFGEATGNKVDNLKDKLRELSRRRQRQRDLDVRQRSHEISQGVKVKYGL